MKTRSVTLPHGQTFTVPQNVQRIDSRSTHGWQVRYQGTKFFSDGSPDGTGSDLSLKAATKELMRRIATMAAPVPLRDNAPLANKKSGLPAGISGPIVRTREGEQQRTAVLSVLLPRFGETPQVKTIYIGTEKTYTQKRFKLALAKAVAMRAESVERYRKEATRARRKDAKATMAAMA